MAFNPTNNDCDEAMRFDAPIADGPAPRWQRKMQSQDCTTPRKGDRFIPARSAMNMSAANFALTKENSPSKACSSPSKVEYQEQLSSSLFEGQNSAKILALKNKAPAPKEGYQNQLRVLYTAQKSSGIAKSQTRNIPQAPERVLDAPELRDDYYLNLLDWNSSNQLAVALGQSVYSWDASTGNIIELCKMEGEETYVTSVAWIKEGSYLAVGSSDNTVQLWDAERQKRVRSMIGHSDRVSSLSWNQHILSSGSRSGYIHNHDVRIAQPYVQQIAAHTQEVCGLKWNDDGTQLASGGNDNILKIWENGRFDAPKFTLDSHQAAVKALAWCPWEKNLLASGGGTADRHIRFWNTQTGACLNSIDTQSQVCSLLWSKDRKEIVSSHGFSQNQLIVWKYPSLAKVAELTGHTSRVLHMAMSPDGQTVVSAAGDETLRFWKCFEQDAKSKQKKTVETHSSSMMRATIR